MYSLYPQNISGFGSASRGSVSFKQASRMEGDVEWEFGGGLVLIKEEPDTFDPPTPTAAHAPLSPRIVLLDAQNSVYQDRTACSNCHVKLRPIDDPGKRLDEPLCRRKVGKRDRDGGMSLSIFFKYQIIAISYWQIP